MREKARETSKILVDWCKANDVENIKFGHAYDTSWPDRIYLFPGGVSAFIEWKQPGKAPTEGQQRRIDWLRSRGFLVEVFSESVEALKWLNGILISIRRQLNGSSITTLLQPQPSEEGLPSSSILASARRQSRSPRSKPLDNTGIFGEP